MARQTKLMKITFPSADEEPFTNAHQQGMVETDQIQYANSENGNLVWSGGGTVSWTAGTNTLTWDADIKLTAMTTGARFAVISAGSLLLEDGEVAFFVMPRLMIADQVIQVVKSNRVFNVDARLNNLRLFVARIGDTLFFGNDGSMVDGDSGPLFGGGLSGGGGAGTVTSIISTDTSVTVTNPAGPIVDVETSFAGSGGNFGVAASSARSDHSHAGVTHTHEIQLKIEPGVGVTVLNLNADALIGAKTLIWAEVFRNGQRLSESDDLTINLGLQTAALLFTSLLTDRFIINRITT
jgi:hypothetical protein